VKKHLAFSTVALIATANSYAETSVDTPANGEWKGNVELGFVTTTGNTETETLNAKAKVETEREKWRHAIKAEALNSSNSTSSTAERYLLAGQSDYKFGERKQNYLFILLSYEDDRFSGYDYRAEETFGYGRRVLERPSLALDLEIGPGARQSKLENDGTDNEFTVRGAAKLAWAISDTSTFSEDLSVVKGEDVTITKSITALSAQIAGSLATKLTYTIKNTSDVPTGIEKTDTEMAVTLVYDF
jgi:putative salt-induced outer membrane protein